MCALCAGVLCAHGCNSTGGNRSSDSVELAGGRDGPSPIDSASTRGLEIRLWVVDDTDWAAARLLSAYTNDASNQIDDASALQWSDWGLRLVAVPMDEVQGFLDALTPVQPINVQWLGEFGSWRAIVRAGELRTGHVRVGNGWGEVAQGRPRLIARSWVEPMLTADNVVPALRIDLGMQIEIKKRRNDPQLLGIDRQRMIEDVGPVLDELMMSMVLDGSHAVVIVGEAPDAQWNQLPSSAAEYLQGLDESETERAFGPGEYERSSETEPTQSEQDQTNGQARPASRGFSEPAKPTGKTLGELMFTSSGSRIVKANESRVAPKRVIVVLIPRVQGGFSLLGNQSQGGQP